MTNLRTDEIVCWGYLTKLGTDENKAIYSSCILWVFNNVGLAASQTYLMPTFSDSKPTSKLEINSPKLKLIDLFTNKYILFTYMYNSGGRKVSDRRIELKKNHSD